MILCTSLLFPAGMGVGAFTAAPSGRPTARRAEGGEKATR